MNKNGPPYRIRTCDFALRRGALYPAELRVVIYQEDMLERQWYALLPSASSIVLKISLCVCFIRDSGSNKAVKYQFLTIISYRMCGKILIPYKMPL